MDLRIGHTKIKPRLWFLQTDTEEKVREVRSLPSVPLPPVCPKLQSPALRRGMGPRSPLLMGLCGPQPRKVLSSPLTKQSSRTLNKPPEVNFF